MVPHIPAVLLAAGRGSRLAPLTDSLPKCLAPVMGRPMLDFWLESCARAGMKPLIVNTHYLANQVERFIECSPWRQLITLVRETSLLGTGGTLLALRNLLDKGTFLVAHADNLSFFDMDAFFQTHLRRPRNCLITAMLFYTSTPHSCGIVELDRQGIVRAFHEKISNPPGNLANGAVYLMEPEIFPLLERSDRAQPDISLDLLTKCVGRIATFLNVDYHRDIGTPESYTVAQSEMRCRFPSGWPDITV